MQTFKSKAARILRQALSDWSIPETTQNGRLIRPLQNIHEFARSSATKDTLSLCSHFSIILCQRLLQDDKEIVLSTYSQSLEHFGAKKASTIQPEFLAAFIKKFPVPASSLLDVLLQIASDQSVTPFRRVQCIALIKDLVKASGSEARPLLLPAQI